MANTLEATILASPLPTPTLTKLLSTLATMSRTAPVIIGLAPTSSISPLPSTPLSTSAPTTPVPSASPTNQPPLHIHPPFPWLWFVIAAAAIYFSACGICAGWWFLRRRRRNRKRSEERVGEIELVDREAGEVEGGQGQRGGGERVRVQESRVEGMGVHVQGRGSEPEVGQGEGERELRRVESRLSVATTIVGSIGRAF